MNLSEEQSKVVHATESQIAVIGPPGTGKTRVLTERIKWLLEQGVPQTDIVAITFTNFAANEMRARLPECKDMYIGTMHSYAAQLLIKNGIQVNLPQIIATGDFSQLINRANSVTLEMKPIKFLFVDEVQDLCDFEFTFINRLRAENLFLGGDSDQCIYRFKGANPKLFNDYCKNEKTKTYILTHNYRCGQNIIEWAEYFVMYMPDRIPVTVTGNLINRGWVHKVDFEETIFNIINSKTYGNWFVLTRTNSELDAAARELRSYGIPFTSFKQGDFTNEEIKKFLENDEVKLLTIHSAKGLEADNVVVIGARNWNDEEKCIEYVASTRARKELYWCPSIGAPKRRANKKKPYKPTPKAPTPGIVWE